MDVPEIETWLVSMHLRVDHAESHSAAHMFTPGAATSGLRFLFAVGPRELKYATASLLSVAAIVIAFSAEPGVPIAPSLVPLLPAATIATTPRSTARSTANDNAEFSSPPPPRLMLKISRWSE